MKSKKKVERKGGSSRAAHGSPHVWIVEMLHDGYEHKGWRQTVGCCLDRRDGRAELKAWKRRNPGDRFRLTRYSPTTRK